MQRRITSFHTKPRKPMKRTGLRKVSPNKVNKPKAHDASWWQKKCDNKMQDIGRKLHANCMVCGGPNQVGHHYHTKSSSSYLRYDWRNLIPLCHACHFKHHIKCDPAVHNTVNAKKGQDWIDSLEADRRKGIKAGVAYYQQIYSDLESYETQNN